MRSCSIVQPPATLGHTIEQLLSAKGAFRQIIFVSAFVALRTILRLRERLLKQRDEGCDLRLVVGIDLGGTSREVLEELLHWRCPVRVFHNPTPVATFHPKIYLFDHGDFASLIVGSNNLTDGGFYTNYEVAIEQQFTGKQDAELFKEALQPLQLFLCPHAPTALPLNRALIDSLVAAGTLPTEAQARARRGDRAASSGMTPHPFVSAPVNPPPRLPAGLGGAERQPVSSVSRPRARRASGAQPRGVLVWRKVLSKSDAQHVSGSAKPVGSLRLTQAKFKAIAGQAIDQTTYFFNLFRDFDWEQEPGKRLGQTHAFVPMRVSIRGVDHGVQNFELSHNPSREAGQRNFTTVLRWGRDFIAEIRKARLTGKTLFLYDTGEESAPFHLEIN